MSPEPTRRLKVAVDPVSAEDRRAIDDAAALVVAGRLVAFPTETVYGLGADATSDAAVARVYAAKGRPARNPLIVHASDPEQGLIVARADDRARVLAGLFWPGPLTMVMKRRADCRIADAATAGGPTVAVRVPALSAARALIRAAGVPMVGPSANRSGHVSPTTADHVLADLDGRIAAVLDAGPCPVGVESTVIDLSGPRVRVLRPGAITTSMLRAALGADDLADPADGADLPADDGLSALPSPGMLGSHYAPGHAVRLDATAPLPGRREVLLAYGPPPPGFAHVLQLSADARPREAAQRLYALLRAADGFDVDGIAVAPLQVSPADPDGEILAALADRLGRAAAPRD